MTEHQEQCVIFQWADLQAAKYPCLRFMYASLVGVNLRPHQAASAKRQGVRKGQPDICLPYPVKDFHGLYIELKVGNNKPTKEQVEYIDYLKSVGYRVEVAYGSKEAIDFITDYLEGL